MQTRWTRNPPTSKEKVERTSIQITQTYLTRKIEKFVQNIELNHPALQLQRIAMEIETWQFCNDKVKNWYKNVMTT